MKIRYEAEVNVSTVKSMILIALTEKQIKRIVNVCEDNIANCCYEEGLEYVRQEIESAIIALNHPSNEDLIEKIGDVNWNTTTKVCGNWDTFQEIKKILEVYP